LAIAKRPPYSGYVDPEIAILDERIGPSRRGQFLLCDQFPGSTNERYEDIKRTTAKWDLLFALK